MGMFDYAGGGISGFAQGLQAALQAGQQRKMMEAQMEEQKQRTALLKAQQTIMEEKHKRLGKLGELLMQGPEQSVPAGTPYPSEVGGEAMGGPGSAAGALQAPVVARPGYTPDALRAAMMGAAPEAMVGHMAEQMFPKPQAPHFAPENSRGYIDQNGKWVDLQSNAPSTTPLTPSPGTRIVRTQDAHGRITEREVLDHPTPEKTAQPYTPEIAYLRAVQDPNAPEYQQAFEAWTPGTYPSPEHQNAAKEYQARMEGVKTGKRVGAGLEAQNDRVQLISNIAEAKTMGGLTDSIIRQRSKQAYAIEQAKVALAGTQAYNTTLGRMKAQLTEAEPGTSYAAALEEARASGKPLTGQAAGDVVRYNQYLRATNLLRNEFSDAEILKYVGLGKYQAKQLEQFMQTDPRFMRFMVLNEQLRGTAFGEGGKQLTPFEASVVFGYTPTGREAWGEYYLAKLEEIGPRYRSLMTETLGAARQGRGKYEPSQMPAGGAGPQAPATPQTKTLGGKTYIQRDGKWFEQ